MYVYRKFISIEESSSVNNKTRILFVYLVVEKEETLKLSIMKR
jgi:hypothetical protein